MGERKSDHYDVFGEGYYYSYGLTLSGTANNYATDDWANDQFGYYDPFRYTAGDATTGAQMPPNVVGTVTAQNVDTLSAYFAWTGPDPVPDHVDLVVQTSVSAGASVDYGLSAVTSGLSAKATAALGLDSVTAMAGDAGLVSPQPMSKLLLVRATPTGNVATVSLGGNVQTYTANSLPLSSWIDAGDGTSYYFGPGAGPTSASANASVSASAHIADAEGGHWEGPYYHTNGSTRDPRRFHVWETTTNVVGSLYSFNDSYDPKSDSDDLTLHMNGTMQPYWKWVLDSSGPEPYAPMAHHHAYAYVLGNITVHDVSIDGAFPGSPSTSTNYDASNQTWSQDQQYDYLCSLVWGQNGLEADGDTVSFSISGGVNWDLTGYVGPPFPMGYDWSAAGFVSLDAQLINTLP